ncbi:MAG: pyridoxal phosphate-dependent aminotransferase [Verrucomicrobiota bacterium]|nr:pyridoxal phosphate-dependent aminotransferase [Verrucomicrobiota bacterium]
MSQFSIDVSSTSGTLQPSMTLAITSKAKAMIADGKDVCNMCAGEPDFDTPLHIKEAAIKAIEDGQTKYTPGVGLLSLRRSLSEKFKKDNQLDYDASQIVVSPGGKFSLFNVISVLCEPGDEVIIPSPFWLSYPEMVKSTGATSVFVKGRMDNEYCITPEDLEAAVTDKTKLLILNTPSNPIGNIYPEATLRKIADIAVKHDFMVIADEMYEKLTYDKGYEHVSIASFNDEIYERTVTVNGFSKAYAMTGWRLGYLGAPSWLSGKIGAYQSHSTSNPTTFAQHGAIAALDGTQEPVKEMCKAFKERRDVIYKLLSEIPGMKVVKPHGAFYIFPDISSFGLGSMEFCDRLLKEEEVAAVPGLPFDADKNIRLSYARDIPTITEAVSRIARFCASL